MFKNGKLKDAKLFKENGKYYLSLTYTGEDMGGVYELIIPKMNIHDCLYNSPLFEHKIISMSDVGTALFDDCRFNLCKKDVCYNGIDGKEHIAEDVFYLVNTVEKKTHKMTLSEIEEKLGYKVEIVSKKED